jgi:hypothetical protein
MEMTTEMTTGMILEWLRLDPLVGWLLRAALAALFASAALHKIRDPRDFLRTFADYEILPERFVAPGAVALVAIEVAVAIGLLAVGGAVVGLTAVSLLVLYSGAIGLNLLRGRREIDCGCLGPAFRQPLSSGLILRNAILATGAALCALPVSHRSLHAIDGISFVGGLATLVLLFHAINTLAAQTAFWPDRENVS